MIYIDSREPESIRLGLPQALGSGPGPYFIQELDAGDIMIIHAGRMALVERKTVSDLLSSVADGRLVAQCSEMSRRSPYPILLIQGTWYEQKGRLAVGARETGWNPWSVRMQLFSLQAAGILTIQTDDDFQSVTETMQYLVKWLESDSHLIVRGRQPQAFAEMSPAERFVSGLPGVGLERTKDLLDHCGSPAYVLEYLSGPYPDVVKGIGPKTRQGVREFLGLQDGCWVQVTSQEAPDDRGTVDPAPGSGTKGAAGAASVPELQTEPAA